MILTQMAVLDLAEIKGALHQQVLSEGYGRLFDFGYANFKDDPRPEVLTLGNWRHPSTGNDLLAGINLHYLSDAQIDRLRTELPQILRSKNLRQRYWTGRKLLPDVFTDAYRTYNKDYIRAVQPGVLKFAPTPDQLKKKRDLDQRVRAAKAADIKQKQKELELAKQAEVEKPTPPVPAPPTKAPPEPVAAPAQIKAPKKPVPATPLDVAKLRASRDREHTVRQLAAQPKPKPGPERPTKEPEGIGAEEGDVAPPEAEVKQSSGSGIDSLTGKPLRRQAPQLENLRSRLDTIFGLVRG